MTRRIRAILGSMLVLWFAHPSTFCQNKSADAPNMTWGEVSPSDLDMKVYPLDTSAAAVVLFDQGITSVNDELGLTFMRHVRIKIFSKAGYDHATQVIDVYTKDHTEKLRDLEGITYNRAADGSVQQTELKGDAVFEEEINNNWTRYKFTFPALQPGCIVDFKYVVMYKEIYTMPDWDFQTSIPVAWSDYKVVYPVTFAYATVAQGYFPFDVSEWSQAERSFSGETASYLNQREVKCNIAHWVLRNAPAVREEPYMTTTSDYIQTITIQLAEYASPYGGVKKLIKSWDKFVEDYLKAKQFGDAISDSKAIRRATDSLYQATATPEERMKAIYDFLRSTIVWNEHAGKFVSQDVEDVLESRKGNCADITILMVSMLRHAGIDAVPVLLSTRKNGKIQEGFPIESQFNYTLACATIGGKHYFLDATDRFRPCGVLPASVLNVRGILIKTGSPEWVTLTAGAAYDQGFTVTATLAADGGIDGAVEVADTGYAAITHRKSFRDGKETERMKGLLDADRASLAVDSVTTLNIDSVGIPLTLRAHISSASYAQAAGNLLYVNPVVVDRLYENPLKMPKREFPVDMMYNEHETRTFVLTIPEGYAVKELPVEKSTHIGHDAEYRYAATVDGRKIAVKTSLAFNNSIFMPNTYNRLKEFFDQMVSYESAQIVLERHDTTKGTK